MLLFAADETYRAKVANVGMDEKKAAADREKAGLDMLAKLREEAHQAELKSKKEQEDAKVNAEADARLKEIEALKVSEQLKRELIAEAQAARKGKLAQNAADDELSQIDRLVKASENEKLSMAARLTALDEYMARVKESTFLTEQDKTTFEASAAETRKSISESEYEHKKAMAEATANVLGAAANMFSKQTAAYKVLAIAQATINTFVGVSDALQAKSFTVFDTVLKFTNAAMILEAGIANVRKIVAVQVPNATVSAPSMPSISAPAPLSTRQQTATTQLPQEQMNQIGNATVRAFVVESDMTNSQERIARLNRAARLGG